MLMRGKTAIMFSIIAIMALSCATVNISAGGDAGHDTTIEISPRAL